MAEEKECLNRGKKFIPTCHITRQKYRSNECRYRYNNAKRYYPVPVNICPACGSECRAGRWRRYCSRSCATAAWFTPRARRGSRRIPSEEAESWRENLTEAARAAGAGKRGKRVRLVRGITSMYTGLDGQSFGQGKRRALLGAHAAQTHRFA